MSEFNRSKVVFHPCPREFPDLWKRKCLTPYQVTAEDIQGIRELYLTPDMPENIAIACVKSIKSPHGFLVYEGMLMGPHGGIEAMEGLSAIVEGFNLPNECLERARAFGAEYLGPSIVFERDDEYSMAAI